MHRDNRLGAWRNGLADTFGIDIQTVGLDVDEYRDRADIADRLGRRDEGEGRGDDLVALADTGREQGQVQGLGTGGTADCMLDAEIVSGFLFKRLHIGAEDEAGFAQGLQDRGIDFRFQG